MDWKGRVRGVAARVGQRVSGLVEGAVRPSRAGRTGRREVFHLVLIKPTHYDDDGYPITWYRILIPSNSLSCLHGLARDCAAREVLGPDVELHVTAIDETSQRVDVERILRDIRTDGGRALVGLVGVQSNQFPRAMDLARRFIAAGVPVSLGGFHVSGSISMLDETPPEIQEAEALGVSLFLGEAEDGRFDQVLRDAYAGKLAPRYDYLDDLPNLQGQPTPFLPREQVVRTHSNYAAFDLGRGCPFQCSFCTIINVQGRKSRFRGPDDLERIVRENAAIGVDCFFLTDDNLARNKNWEACFDRLIELREKEGLAVRLQVQVDTLCHRIPRFIDKAAAAGVDQVFVGMENINPDNLAAVGKKQNRTTEYREMLLAWKRHPVVITAGYIIGFPNDTRASIVRDVEIIKRELPIDLIYFTYLTPLPGSEDHRRLAREGTWMDPDLNKFDLNHRVTHHPRMSDEEWEQAYLDAWNTFYTWDHMETVLRRMVALGSNKRLTTINRLLWYREFVRLYGIHPLESGFLRIKVRNDRRPGFARQTAVEFLRDYGAELGYTTRELITTYARLRIIMERLWAARAQLRTSYADVATTPPSEDEHERLELFSGTRGGAEAVEKDRERRRLRVLQGGAGQPSTALG